MPAGSDGFLIGADIYYARPLIKDMVPEKGVDHMAHGDSQGGASDVVGPQLQLAGPLVGGQVSQSGCS